MLEIAKENGLLEMVRGPKGEYRPKDPIAAAAAVARIATGETDEAVETARAIAADKPSKQKRNKKIKIRLRTIER